MSNHFITQGLLVGRKSGPKSTKRSEGTYGALFILRFNPPDVPNGSIKNLLKNNSELALRTQRLIL